MKYSTFYLFFISLSLAFFSLNSEEVDGNYGDFIQCANNEAVGDICTSGRNADCVDKKGNKVWTIIECNSWGTYTNVSKKSAQDYNGWKCAKYGTHLTCPGGQAIIGICGSGTNEDCELNCSTEMTEAVLCSDPPSPYAVFNDGTWKNPTSYGVFGHCPDGSVACGFCSSGGNADCDGNYGRIQCCSFLNCTPKRNWGYWEFVKSGSSTKDSITITYGVELSKSVNLTESLSETFSASISSGFTFVEDKDSTQVEVSASYAKTVTQEVISSFNVTIGVTTTAHCDFAPYVLWQWRLDSDGSCPANTYTNAYACTSTTAEPPCCLPGYAEDVKYSECYSGSPNICKKYITPN